MVFFSVDRDDEKSLQREMSWRFEVFLSIVAIGFDH